MELCHSVGWFVTGSAQTKQCRTTTRDLHAQDASLHIKTVQNEKSLNENRLLDWGIEVDGRLQMESVLKHSASIVASFFPTLLSSLNTYVICLFNSNICLWCCMIIFREWLTVWTHIHASEVILSVSNQKYSIRDCSLLLLELKLTRGHSRDLTFLCCPIFFAL